MFRIICCEKYETAISSLVEGSETFLIVSYTIEIGGIKWQVYFAIKQQNNVQIDYDYISQHV